MYATFLNAGFGHKINRQNQIHKNKPRSLAGELFLWPSFWVQGNGLRYPGRNGIPLFLGHVPIKRDMPLKRLSWTVSLDYGLIFYFEDPVIMRTNWGMTPPSFFLTILLFLLQIKMVEKGESWVRGSWAQESWVWGWVHKLIGFYRVASNNAPPKNGI